MGSTPTQPTKPATDPHGCGPLTQWEAAIEHCPACNTNMRLAMLHCQNAQCIWLVCGACKAVISDSGGYWTKDDG